MLIESPLLQEIKMRKLHSIHVISDFNTTNFKMVYLFKDNNFLIYTIRIFLWSATTTVHCKLIFF